jgi:ATP-dependent helicase/nuclease subunit A
LRLLYVAMTRARDTLILSGGISEKKWETFFESQSAVTPGEILSARNSLDWLAIWFKVQSPKPKVQSETQGELPHLRWRIVGDEALGEIGNQKSEIGNSETPYVVSCDEMAAKKLRGVLDWKYGFESATKRAAKTSVTALRRQAEESNDEAEQKFSTSSFQFSGKRSRIQNPKSEIRNPKLSAADTGAATHKFLQHFKFESAADLKSLEAEAARLEEENYLSPDERAVLNLENVLAFWNSEIGKKICENAAFVKRELPFTVKCSPKELDEILGTKSSANLKNEFVVVQGVADLVLLLPKEIWIVDFKTDDVRAKDLPDKIKFYSPQLKLYARALEKIYSRPVTNCWLQFLSARRTEKIQSGS